MRKAGKPLSLATEAMQLVHGLMQRGAVPDRVTRELAAEIAGWIEAERAGAEEAVESLCDQLAAAVEDTASEVGNLDRDDAAGIRAGQRVIACLEAARDAARAALARL